MSRQKLEFNLENIEALAELGATLPEAANVLGCGHATLERRLEEQEYREAWDRGQSNMKVSLRRRQVKLALDGNATMLIWLGKQYLGQKDQSDVTLSGELGIKRIEGVPLDEV